MECENRTELHKTNGLPEERDRGLRKWWSPKAIGPTGGIPEGGNTAPAAAAAAACRALLLVDIDNGIPDIDKEDADAGLKSKSYHVLSELKLCIVVLKKIICYTILRLYLVNGS